MNTLHSDTTKAVVRQARTRTRWTRVTQVLSAAVLSSSLVTSWAAAEEKSAPKGAKSAAKAPDPNSSMEALRAKLQADEKGFVSQHLELTEAEAKAFWPLYDAYKQDLEKLNTRIGGVLNEFLEVQSHGPLPNDLSKKLLADMANIEKNELDLKLAHLKKVEKVLPPYKVVRCAQLENKIRAILKYDLAAQIPIAK
jgi:hypothetical protein